MARLTLANIYHPIKDTPYFFMELKDKLSGATAKILTTIKDRTFLKEMQR